MLCENEKTSPITERGVEKPDRNESTNAEASTALGGIIFGIAIGLYCCAGMLIVMAALRKVLQ